MVARPNTNAVGNVRPLKDQIIVQSMEFGERKTKSGLILLEDDGKLHGIRPRWGKVYAVGPDQDEIKVGQWILIKHGRWTRGVGLTTPAGENLIIRKVDNDDVIGVWSDDSVPSDDNIIASNN